MADQTRYEKVQRKSFEDTESCTDSSTPNDNEDFTDADSSRTTKILKHLQCHRRLLIISIGALVTICAGVILISLRVMGIIGTKEDEIMNLLDIEGDPSIHFSNPTAQSLTSPHPAAVPPTSPAREAASSTECPSPGCPPPLPPPCLDTEMMERYISDRTWEWYEDYSMTKKLDLEVVGKGEYKWAFSMQQLLLV
ncbi:hypothetical protein BDZ45DRAFT_809439 [Acephala macrosclerotiorum]|nr:hypothetical protein BDZ45DRAFT_809439 [Acephala macrosclerotiorum]